MTHALDTQPASAPVLKPLWTRPGEIRKALLAALVAFFGPAVIAGTETVQHGWSFLALSLWLTAAVTGLAAFAGVLWIPNDPAGRKVLTDDVVRVLLDVAAHKPAGTVMQDTVTTVGDAEQISWKQKYVQGNATPPAPVTVSTTPYTTVAGGSPTYLAAANPAPPAFVSPPVVTYSPPLTPPVQTVPVVTPTADAVVATTPPVSVSVTPSPVPRDPVEHSTDLPSATGSTAYTGPVPPVTSVVNVQPPEGHFLLPGTSL